MFIDKIFHPLDLMQLIHFIKIYCLTIKFLQNDLDDKTVDPEGVFLLATIN